MLRVCSFQGEIMNMSEIKHFFQTGVVLKFPDDPLKRHDELMEALPLRFLAMEQNTSVKRRENDTRNLWDGYLLAHPLTKGRVGDNAISLFYFNRVSNLLDWQVLTDCPTTLDVSTGTIELQLSEESLKNLHERINNKERGKKTENSVEMLKHYRRLAMRLKVNASWYT